MVIAFKWTECRLFSSFLLAIETISNDFICLDSCSFYSLWNLARMKRCAFRLQSPKRTFKLNQSVHAFWIFLILILNIDDNTVELNSINDNNIVQIPRAMAIMN